MQIVLKTLQKVGYVLFATKVISKLLSGKNEGKMNTDTGLQVLYIKSEILCTIDLTLTQTLIGAINTITRSCFYH